MSNLTPAYTLTADPARAFLVRIDYADGRAPEWRGSYLAAEETARAALGLPSLVEAAGVGERSRLLYHACGPVGKVVAELEALVKGYGEEVR